MHAGVMHCIKVANGTTLHYARIPGDKGADSLLANINHCGRTVPMLLRLRPAWSKLAAQLAEMRHTTRKYEVYVCTAATKEYALQVCIL
jgi:hypothetical protein